MHLLVHTLNKHSLSTKQVEWTLSKPSQSLQSDGDNDRKQMYSRLWRVGTGALEKHTLRL